MGSLWKAKSMTISLDEEINTFGKFILYHIANLYLSSDFDKCLHYCYINFSFVENSKVFESNLLRFRALAKEGICIERTSGDID